MNRTSPSSSGIRSPSSSASSQLLDLFHSLSKTGAASGQSKPTSAARRWSLAARSRPGIPSGNAVEDRSSGPAPRSAVFDLFPVRLDLVGIGHLDVTEDMRVAPDQFLAKVFGHVLDIERAGLSGDGGVEEDLQEDVSQLVLEAAFRFRPDRLHQFIGLLDQVLDQALVSLFAIPGALFAEPRHDLNGTDHPARGRIENDRGAHPGQIGIHLVERRLDDDFVRPARRRSPPLPIVPSATTLASREQTSAITTGRSRWATPSDLR